MLCFSIRDMLWLTALIAVTLMWRVERRRWGAEREVLKASHEDLLALKKLLGDDDVSQLVNASKRPPPPPVAITLPASAVPSTRVWGPILPGIDGVDGPP